MIPSPQCDYLFRKKTKRIVNKVLNEKTKVSSKLFSLFLYSLDIYADKRSLTNIDKQHGCFETTKEAILDIATSLPSEPCLRPFFAGDASRTLYTAQAMSWDSVTPILNNPLKTTMIYTHVLNRGGRGVLSPLDD
jgi:hypothetical protein